MAFQGAKCDCIKKPLNGDFVLQLLSYMAQIEREFMKKQKRQEDKDPLAFSAPVREAVIQKFNHTRPAKACSKSAMMSSGSSRPMEMRTRPSEMPEALSSSEV